MPDAGYPTTSSNNPAGIRPKGMIVEKCCKDCKHFHDAHYSKTYITPVCLAHGGDDASFFRKYICGIDTARLFEPLASSLPPQQGAVRPE